MTRREMAFQGLLAVGVVIGIVGGNFVLHRWILGNAPSREADAGTTGGAVTDRRPAAESLSGSEDSLRQSISHAEFETSDLVPSRRVDSPEDAERITARRRQQLAVLIAEKMPQASPEDRAAWLDRLQDVELDVAAGILDLRQRLGPLDTVREKSPTDPVSVD